MSKPDKPVNKVSYERWWKRMCDTTPGGRVMNQIPALYTMQCRCLLVAYHGNYWRAAWAIFSGGVHSSFYQLYWSAVYRWCDVVGWTQLRPTAHPGLFIRHSARCDKLNCDYLDCVQEGIPRWFQKLTRMHKFLGQAEAEEPEQGDEAGV